MVRCSAVLMCPQRFSSKQSYTRRHAIIGSSISYMYIVTHFGCELHRHVDSILKRLCCTYEPLASIYNVGLMIVSMRQPAYRRSMTVGRTIDAQNTARPFVMNADWARLASNRMKLETAISHSYRLQTHTLAYSDVERRPGLTVVTSTHVTQCTTDP